MNGCDLHITDGALRAIAQQAMTNGTGARGLRQIMERVLNDAMYEIPDMDTATALVLSENADEPGKVVSTICTAKVHWSATWQTLETILILLMRRTRPVLRNIFFSPCAAPPLCSFTFLPLAILPL